MLPQKLFTVWTDFVVVLVLWANFNERDLTSNFWLIINNYCVLYTCRCKFKSVSFVWGQTQLQIIIFDFGSEPEPQILDYLTQQHKLLVGIASVHAFRINANWLWNMYNNVTAELENGDMERLPEVYTTHYL